MKLYVECLPCVMRQAVEATRQCASAPDEQWEILRETARLVSQANVEEPSPALIGAMHEAARKITGRDDPYREVKAACNKKALELYPQLRNVVSLSDDPLETAVRLAIAGNNIDFVADPHAEQIDLPAAVDEAIQAPLGKDVFQRLREAVDRAKTILYLGDNAGEIVFDRILIEELPREKVCYVVKGRPVVNDVTMEDAEVAGLRDMVEVITNGSAMPGTVLHTCSESFRKRFRETDLIISKGQANYESLEHLDQRIFFLFKAKCHVMTLHLGCPVGAILVVDNGVASDWAAGA
ncbi:MAG: damage-control phosphatase ARMT1 family protein [Desulfomonilaceae bacterium]